MVIDVTDGHQNSAGEKSMDAAGAGMAGLPITVRSLTKRFADVVVLEDVDLTVPGGSFGAVLGKSGSGKTTLLRIIAGFERADSGEVVVGTRVLSSPTVHVATEVRRVGIVPQDGALFPHLDVAANVAFGLPAAVRRGAEGRARVAELLTLVGLEGLGRRMPSELSGGQQQRVAVARCLAPRPDVVLLDEPFSALDATLRASVRRDVAAALLSSGTTTVLVTHDQEEALAMASTVAVLEAGRIAQAADPVTLYRFPASERVARFLGDANIVPGRVDRGVASCVFGAIRLRSDNRSSVGHRNGLEPSAACRLLLRPEQLDARRLADDPVENPGSDHERVGRGTIGVVKHLEFHGHDALATIELSDSLTVMSRLRDPAAMIVGDRVLVTVHGDAIAFPAIS